MVDDDIDLTSEELMNFVLFVCCDLLSYEEAAQDDCWFKVMDKEIHVIEKNNTWEPTNLPNSKKSITIYKTKYKTMDQKWTASTQDGGKRLLAKLGIDYFEIFAFIARLDTIRMIIPLATQNNWKIFHLF